MYDPGGATHWLMLVDPAAVVVRPGPHCWHPAVLPPLLYVPAVQQQHARGVRAELMARGAAPAAAGFAASCSSQFVVGKPHNAGKQVVAS